MLIIQFCGNIAALMWALMLARDLSYDYLQRYCYICHCNPICKLPSFPLILFAIMLLYVALESLATHFCCIVIFDIELWHQLATFNSNLHFDCNHGHFPLSIA